MKREATSFEKPSQAKSMILKRLWHYLAQYRWLLALAIGLTIASNLLALLGPKLSGQAIDAIGTVSGRVNFPRDAAVLFDGSGTELYFSGADGSYQPEHRVSNAQGCV